MQDDAVPQLGYYLVAYLDVLGQSDKLRQLTKLPKTTAEERAVIRTLSETALTVKRLREALDHHFVREAPLPESAALVPPEHREEFRKAFSVLPTYRGFSDSIVISVPLAAPLGDESKQLAALMAVHRTLHAVSTTLLLFLSTVGSAIRGGIDVGLGVEIVKDEYYGRALVEAYLLERDEADYPRVLVGDGVTAYLESVAGASFASPRLRAMALDTVTDCRRLILNDPSDGLPAIDPLWILDDRQHPGYDRLLQMEADAALMVTNAVEKFAAAGNEKLARRYERLAAFLAASPRAHNFRRP